MQTSDADLIRQCLEGDNLGFDVLVKRYQKRVLGYCYRILGNIDLASDATQESFVKAYYALENFRPDAEVLPWLLRIANNTSIDMMRTKNEAEN